MTVCRHIHWHVESDDTFGIVTCEDCKEKLRMSDAVNNTMTYVKALIQELEAIINTDVDKSVTSKPRGRPKKDG